MVRNALVTLVALTLLGAAFAAKTKGAAGSEAVSILEKRCLQCHSEQLKMSGLRLTSRELLMTGGTRGPAKRVFRRVKAAEMRVDTHDINATLLRLIGMDHEKLTYPFQGRDQSLTDVHGQNEFTQKLLG